MNPVPTAKDPRAEARAGLFASIGAFLIWGVFPIYLHALRAVPALQIICHRVVWCAVIVLVWLAVRGDLAGVWTALRTPATRWRLCASALLISINWLVYVWAIGHNHIVDGSLGYFINPLINVLLGVVLLSERLNPLQWLSVATAATGVAWLTYMAGQLPWISLILGVSFSGYGLIRKMVAVEAVTGLAAETLLLAPLGLGYLLWQQFAGPGMFAGETPIHQLMLLGSGLITAVPLAMFAFGARRIPYSMVGIVQYIGPTLQLLCGVFLFGEPFQGGRVLGFSLIWLALVIYAGEGIWRMQRQRQEGPAVQPPTPSPLPASGKLDTADLSA